MNTTYNTYNPDYAIHPGEYLEEVLEVREIKQRELADRMGVKEAYLSKLIHGEKPVGPDTALKLERVLGISSDIWNNMNSNFRLFEAKMKEKEILLSKTDWAKGFPLAWLKKMGFIPDTRKTENLMEHILEFFGVFSPEIWESFYHKQAVSYRKSTSFTINLKANASWLRASELIAEKIQVQSYDKALFQNNLDKIRNLTIRDPQDFEPIIKQLCSESGVALVFMPEPPKVHVYGATKWLNSNKAMIVLSLRRKSDDQFWFNFFHEAGHILLHGKKETFIDDKEMAIDKKEDEANHFAREKLIPIKEYELFRKAGVFYPANIIEYAKKMNIAPGIIVGFLQHDGLIDYKFHNRLKRRFKLSV